MMTGDDLRAWRTRKKLTQAALAGRLGLTNRTVMDYENGKRPIPELVALALRTLDREVPDAS